MVRTKVIRGLGVALCACTLMSVANAQTQQVPKLEDAEKHRMPTVADMEREMKRAREVVNKDQKEGIDWAVRRATMGPLAGQRGVNGMPSQPGLPDASKVMGAKGVDIAKLAQEYGAPDSPMQGADPVYKLVAFVSLSMPEGSLKKLGRDLKKAGGVMIVRGTKYGIGTEEWGKSIEALKPIVETGVQLEINPALFKQFEIKTVPTIVVSPKGIASQGCQEDACAAGNVGIIRGDVSLDYALDKLADRQDEVGRFAEKLYKKVEM